MIPSANEFCCITTSAAIKDAITGPTCTDYVQIASKFLGSHKQWRISDKAVLGITERMEGVKMTQVSTEKVEYIIADLAYALETALLRLEAYRQIVEKDAISLVDDVYALEQALKDSPQHRQFAALRTQALHAVRDSDTDTLSANIASISALARYGVGLRRTQ
jgi:hypothetical protein